MSERYEIRVAGSGGQGVILAAVILGEAAVLHEGINAVQSQAYGPEARGGSSKSEVVVSRAKSIILRPWRRTSRWRSPRRPATSM
jgi:2-oxoglutarate ferredoxin oxidoreductase subunit gamma